MRDSMYIGSVPANEICDPSRERYECQVYAEQLVREHGHPPEGAQLIIARNPHDYREIGGHLSVSLVCDPSDPKHMEYFLKCEGEGSLNWDTQSLDDLSRFIP